jgi:hypothetical protein
MKTFSAYGIDPKALFNSLKAANQPVQEIRYRGPRRTDVAIACVCLADSADDTAVKSVIGSQSGAKPDWNQVDEHVEALAQGIGRMMQAYKG